jgi:hypothetical protein
MLSFPSAVAENQPANKHRMYPELSSFATRLRGLIQQHDFLAAGSPLAAQFDALALELFKLQFESNLAYQKICAARGLTPAVVEHWTQIPVVPAAAFKELELTSLPPNRRTAVFHSSGTTEQKPSRHFHGTESLAVYEASLWNWFEAHFKNANAPVFLTPPSSQAPHSSLIHMFEVVRQNYGAPESAFVGKMAADGTWTLDFDATVAALDTSLVTRHPLLVLGTAFSFVHLLDYLAENNLRFSLAAGSRVMETGGYKNRSRTMPKAELHALITDRLGVPRENIICEYGMSELSSQAYEGARPSPGAATLNVQAASSSPEAPALSPLLHSGRMHSGAGVFNFPPWAKTQIISPETGREVADGETGLIRIFDLANVFSVAALQTEDLGVRRGDGFELIGRAQLAESRGCSLMTA